MQCRISSKINPKRVCSVKFYPILDGSMMYRNSCEWISKNNNQFKIFKYLKAKMQGFHLTPIRIIIMHELLLRKYGSVAASPDSDSDSMGESESESGLESGLGLYPCGLGLGLGLHLGGLGLKRCGLGLWSHGLGLGLGLHSRGLGLTVSPGESCEKCNPTRQF